MNRVEKLIYEYYTNKWCGWVHKPEPLSDEDLMSGDWYYDDNINNPTMIMHTLWDDSNIEDTSLESYLKLLKDPEATKEFCSEFIEDTFNFVKSLREIPEYEREEEWYQADYPDPLTRREMIRCGDLCKAYNTKQCQHLEDSESCDENCHKDGCHGNSMGYVCPVCNKQICIKKMAKKDIEGICNQNE